MFERLNELNDLKNMITVFPVTALIGVRQCGKTTLTQFMKADHYFDLENPRDEAKFSTPQLLLEDLKGLIVIDEIQRKPDLFSILRFLVDKHRDQKYLILGSASRDLISNGSETLAGRIGFYHLSGFTLSDVGNLNVKNLWLRGKFPRSYLTEFDSNSILWRENYITTFLERDIPQLGINIPARTLRRFWMILAHYHGQVINYAEIGRSFGISDMTVRKYIDILEGTFMVRVLQPYYNNVGKRQIKSSKLYIRDSGILHTLLSIENYDQLLTNPKLGASWEGFALEEVVLLLKKRNEEVFFWSTHSGAEVDLFFTNKGKQIGVEFKYSDAPKLTKSMKIALIDLNLDKLIVVYPGKDSYQLDKQISVIPLTKLESEMLC